MKIRSGHIAGAIVFALLAGALTYFSINNGFSTDDHFMRALFKGFPGLDRLQRAWFETFAFSKGSAPENAWLRDKGVFPWWTVMNAKLYFFRPLASATHWFDYTYFADRPRPMHIENVLWYAIMCGLAFVLYREICFPLWTAWLAGFMYAADEVHGQAVGWISSRNTLMVTCAAIVVLIAHHRWRTARRDRWAVLAIATFGAGLLSGEGTIAVCGYLFAYAVTMDAGGWRARIGSLLPYGAIAGPYLVLYRVYGFGSAGSSWYADPGSDPTGWLRLLGTNLPILFFTEMFAWPAPLFGAGWPLAAVYFVLLIAIVVAALLAMWPLLRSSARARFWLIGSFIALLPVSSVVAQPRILTLSSIGVMALLAEFMAGWFGAKQFAKLIATIIGLTILIRLVDLTLRLGTLTYFILVPLLAGILFAVIKYGDRPAIWMPQAAWKRGIAAAFMGIFLIAHLIAGPNLLPVQAMVHGAVARKLDTTFASLPFDASVVNRDLVVLQSANDFTCYYAMLERSANGQLMPEHMRILSSSFRPLTIERPNANSLVLRTSDGFVGDRDLSIYRSRKYPMRRGDAVRLTGVTVTVLKTDEAGWPMDASFEFDKPLDDDRYLWYTGATIDERNPRTNRLRKADRYFPIVIPAVGERATAQELLERSPQYQAALAAARAPRPATP